MNGKNVVVAVYALTRKGSDCASQLAEALGDAELFLPAEFASDGAGFQSGGLIDVVRENWNDFAGHVCIMDVATVVESVAGLMNEPLRPAVVVCDESGRFVVSLLGGSQADRLAERVAATTGGDAVVASQAAAGGLVGFEEMAASQGWSVENPKKIGILNDLLRDGKRIAVKIPPTFFQSYMRDVPTCFMSNRSNRRCPTELSCWTRI